MRHDRSHFRAGDIVREPRTGDHGMICAGFKLSGLEHMIIRMSQKLLSAAQSIVQRHLEWIFYRHDQKTGNGFCRMLPCLPPFLPFYHPNSLRGRHLQDVSPGGAAFSPSRHDEMDGKRRQRLLSAGRRQGKGYRRSRGLRREVAQCFNRGSPGFQQSEVSRFRSCRGRIVCRFYRLFGNEAAALSGFSGCAAVS